MARTQGCYQQAEVREDRREEAVDADKRSCGRLPWFVPPSLLSLALAFSSPCPLPLWLQDQSRSLARASVFANLFLRRLRFTLAEEFAIYLNYVRKLGFEETPDYDFLRELFTKALKSTGEVEDGVYDWMLLNGGKGWEASSVSSVALCSSSTGEIECEGETCR